MNTIDWTETSDKLPEHGQRVWVLFPSGNSYPATYEGPKPWFISEQPEIEFRQQPTRWRSRE